MAEKKFKLSAGQIKNLVRGHGGCLASDRITVNGLKVGYMVRDASDDPQDSGWQFMSGDETQKYMDDPNNCGIYEVNTIANYDPDIIPFLHSEPGSAFGRDKSGKLVPEGKQPPVPIRRLSEDWSFQLNSGFRSRKEEDRLVFVAPNRTVYVTVWGPKSGETAEQRLAWIKKEANSDPVERYEPAHPSLKKFGYLLMETDDKRGARWALYTTCVSPAGGHLWMAIYFDHQVDLEWARRTWESTEYRVSR